MSAASLIFRDLLRTKQALQAATAEFGSREELLVLRMVAAQIMVETERLAEASRTCPGFYWRDQEVVVQYNNTKEARKGRKVSITNECRTPKGKTPRFKKNQVGPDKEIGICDSCASALERDRNKGICK